MPDEDFGALSVTGSDAERLSFFSSTDTMVSTGDNLASKIAEAAVDKLFLVALAAAGFSARLADQGLLQNVATQNTINALLGWIPALVAVMMMIFGATIDTEKEYRESVAAREEKK